VVVEGLHDVDRGVIDCVIHCNGAEGERLWTKAAGQRLPATGGPIATR